MNRFSLVTLSACIAAITACGGGSSTDVAEGGMGGTGVSQGPVTGFGSIYVNGVKYETDDAVFERDNSELFAQSNFNLGEYVTVKGTVNADGITGTATKVSYSTLLEGPISAIDPMAETITVLGHTISIDALTVNIGYTLISDLTIGNIVEVSGIESGEGAITATAVIKSSDSFIANASELHFGGAISSVSIATTSFTVDGLTVDYATSGFPNGATPELDQEVKVTSTLAPTAENVIASDIQLAQPVQYPANTELELQGVVTRFTSIADFEVNGVSVSTNDSTEFEDGLSSLLALNSRVEVEGRISTTGVLEAEEVSIRETESSIEIEASIETIDPAASSLILLGKTIVVDSGTMLIDEDTDQSFSFSELATGEIIEVHGNLLDSGEIRAVKIEREGSGDSNGEFEIEGTVGTIDKDAFTLILLGVTVTTTLDTEFEAKGELGRTPFFDLLQPAQTKIKVEGVMTAGDVLEAKKIEIDD